MVILEELSQLWKDNFIPNAQNMNSSTVSYWFVQPWYNKALIPMDSKITMVFLTKGFQLTQYDIFCEDMPRIFARIHLV